MENYPMYEVRHHDGRGMAATGIGLAAGLGGGALLLGIAGLWGLNQASKARSQGNASALNTISQFVLAERTSRESWQLAQTPSIRNYVDVQAGAGAGANAFATAYALNGGLNQAIGHDAYLKVQRYSAPVPCGCDTYNG
jgi:hypothetical protein